MRVLEIHALAALATSAACYSPHVVECQFTCPDNACPDDLQCTAGFCVEPGSTATCGSGAPACDDAPDGCVVVSKSTASCLATCATSVTWSSAEALCAAKPGWQLAVFGSTLSSISDITWIGLTRTNLTDDWMWIDSSGTVSSTDSRWDKSSSGQHAGLVNKCAGLHGANLYSDGCATSMHPYACTLK